MIKSRRMRWARYVAAMGVRKVAHRASVERPHGKRPAGRTRRRWKDKINKDLQEARRGTDWIDLAQDRDTWQALRNSIESLQVP